MIMTDEELAKFKGLYLQTAREYISDIQKNLNILKQDKHDEKAVKQIFIAAHSIRSQSFVMKHTFIAYLMTAVQKIFRAIQDKQIGITDELILNIEMSVNKVSESIDSIEKTNKELDLFEQINILEKYIKEHIAS